MLSLNETSKFKENKMSNDEIKFVVEGDDFYVSKEVATFLRNLRPQDIEELQESIKVFNSIKTASSLFKWVMIVIFGALFTAASFSNSLHDSWKALATLFGVH